MKGNKQKIIRFYEFYEVILDLPFVKLLQMFLSKGERIMIHGEDKEFLSELDYYLWSYEDSSFLPHSMEKNEYAAHQPIWISDDEYNVNGAENLILIQGCKNNLVNNFSSITEVFLHKDELLRKKTQEKLQKYLNLGYKTQYYSQSESGKWINQLNHSRKI